MNALYEIIKNNAKKNLNCELISQRRFFFVFFLFSFGLKTATGCDL